MEHEKFGFRLDTLEPMTLDNIHDLLDGMASRFGYERITEDDIVVGLEKVQCSTSPISHWNLINSHYTSSLSKWRDFLTDKHQLRFS